MKSQIAPVDYMTYQDGMEAIETDILERVLAEGGAYDSRRFTLSDAQAALGKERIGIHDFGALISPAAQGLLEPMAVRAKEETARYFGNGVRLFTPLYISNYCVNQCAYCGFSAKNKTHRAMLTQDEISRELEAIAATGLDEVLILTGESREKSDVRYIGQAVKTAADVFGTVGIEIYPLNTDEYRYIRDCGADFVNVYQETYDPCFYEKMHPGGPKRCFPYRFNSQERAILGGMRGVSFGALFGLANALRDAYCAGLHAYLLQKKYPHAEISLSVPRIRAFGKAPVSEGETLAVSSAEAAGRPILGGVDAGTVQGSCAENSVGERQLLQFMLAYRLFMPFAAMTISTRERPGFRDAVTGLCATRISAGVCVGVGGYESAQKGGEQFVISDDRSVEEIHGMLKSRGLQPVYSDYIRV